MEDDADEDPRINLAKSRSGNIDGKIYTQAHNITGSFATSKQDGNSLPKNTWLHLVGTVDKPNNLISLYINGGLQESVTLGSFDLTKATTLKLQLGQFPVTSAGHKHNSLMDEVLIYNRAYAPDELYVTKRL